MQTTHKQVKFKDTTVDKEMLPIIKKLNENGIETIFSCCGLDDGDKDKPAYKLNHNMYIVIKEDVLSNSFIKILLILRYKFMKQDDNAIKLPLIEVNYDFFDDSFRYSVNAINSCTFNAFNSLLNNAVDLWKETQGD